MLRSSMSNEAMFHRRPGYYICCPNALEANVREKMQIILDGGRDGGGAGGFEPDAATVSNERMCA